MSLGAALAEMIKAWELEVDEQAQAQMIVLLQELLRWNKAINLTAIRNETEALEKHIVDSLCLMSFLKGDERVLDIGSGGGFPSIPLKIAMRNLSVTSVDSAGKKINFQKHAVRLLGIEGYVPVHARSEDLAREGGHAQTYDVVVSRAFSSLAEFCRQAMPFLKRGGRVLAMKGAHGEDEVEQEREAIEGLGLVVERTAKRELPLSGGKRVVVELKLKV